MRTKYLLTILVFLFSCTGRKVDYRPFDKLDLKENCAVYFIRSEGDQGKFENTNQDFEIRDKKALEKLKANWGLRLTDKRKSCGFGYLVFITQNDSLIEKIEVNEPCGYAITTGGWYEFNKRYYDFIDLSKVEKLERKQAEVIQKKLIIY